MPDSNLISQYITNLSKAGDLTDSGYPVDYIVYLLRVMGILEFSKKYTYHIFALLRFSLKYERFEGMLCDAILSAVSSQTYGIIGMGFENAS